MRDINKKEKRRFSISMSDIALGFSIFNLLFMLFVELIVKRAV